MKLEAYMWKHDENRNLTVKNRDGEILDFYDGKNSISEKYNNRKVLSIEKDKDRNVTVTIA